MVVGIILAAGASFTAGLFLVHVAVLPVAFKYSKWLHRKIVFSNCVNYPRNLDYENPSKCNVVGGRNFQVEFQSIAAQCPIKIGAWHMIPCSLCHERQNATDATDTKKRHCSPDDLKKTQNPVVLYCHGNSNHRASPHRLVMYKVFQKLNFHVITFDYRGYGDSTHVRPTEAGVVEDAFQMYSWILDNVDSQNRPKLLIWGHSLGTAVASNLVANLSSLSNAFEKNPVPLPDALILESAFNNLCEEIEQHPLSKLVSWLPYYRQTFLKPFMVSSEYAFQTDKHLTSVSELPILMIHAKGDRIVPYSLAVKLHSVVTKSREGGGAPIVLQTFRRGLGLGHNNLCEADSLPTVVSRFLLLVDNYKSVQVSSS